MKKVFISSVVGSFEEYRAAAKKAIETALNHPVMCESFGARPHNSETACLSEVEKCDVFVLILGQRYGFVPLGDELSVTHQEYLVARETNRPILVFIQAGDKEPRQAEFCKTVEDYSGGHFRAAFLTPDELKDQIVQSLIQLDAEAKAASEDEFATAIKQSSEILSRNWQVSRTDSTHLQIAFWRQPVVSSDIVAIEQQADEMFQKMCKAGFAQLRGGYELMTDSEYTAFKSGDNLLFFFESGLTLLRLNPQSSRNARIGFDFDMHFVAPNRVRELINNAVEFVSGRAAWVSVRLSCMKGKNFEELPEQPQRSVSIGNMWGDTDKEYRRLFSPFSKAEYQVWVDQTIARLKRVFNKM